MTVFLRLVHSSEENKEHEPSIHLGYTQLIVYKYTSTFENLLLNVKPVCRIWPIPPMPLVGRQLPSVKSVSIGQRREKAMIGNVGRSTKKILTRNYWSNIPKKWNFGCKQKNMHMK